MQFLLVEKQNGGCDYTIGCGIRTSIIVADNMEHAIAQVSGELNLGNSERSIDKATLYEIKSEHKLDLSALRHARDKKAADEAAEKSLKDKREQLKRLKAELGEG